MSHNIDQAPPAIKRAIRFFWGSFTVACLSYFVSYFGQVPNSLSRAAAQNHFSANEAYGLKFLGLIFNGIVIYFVFDGLRKGASWARIICLIFGIAVLSGAFLTAFRLEEADFRWLNIGFHILYFILGYYALYLLFPVPGKDSFRKNALQ